jgi:hypothetical protein
MTNLISLIENAPTVICATPEYALLTHPLPSVAEWLQNSEQISLSYNEKSWRADSDLKAVDAFVLNLPPLPNVVYQARRNSRSRELEVQMLKTSTIPIRLTPTLQADLQALNAIRQRLQLPEYDAIGPHSSDSSTLH